MLHGDALGLLLGAIALGAVHGVEPGHGWPVAASYALDRSNKWAYGFAASLIIGVGHLVSSIAMVGVFFYAKGYFELTQVNEPIVVLEGIRIGGPVSLVAGVLLIGLGIREYTHGHSHGGHDESHGHDHDHGHADPEDHDHGSRHGHPHGPVHTHGSGHAHDHGSEHAHGPDHDHAHSPDHGRTDEGHHDHGGRTDTHDDRGLLAGIRAFLPFTGGHDHPDGTLDEAADRGLLGIAWFAFVLGFAHEEEFEIIALCAGSDYCLELMGAYALTVITGIVGLTLLLIAGYRRHEEQVERYAPYLPVFSAVVLVAMGLGFITGLF